MFDILTFGMLDFGAETWRRQCDPSHVTLIK
jgi:hypothetical protein